MRHLFPVHWSQFLWGYPMWNLLLWLLERKVAYCLRKAQLVSAWTKTLASRWVVLKDHIKFGQTWLILIIVELKIVTPFIRFSVITWTEASEMEETEVDSLLESLRTKVGGSSGIPTCISSEVCSFWMTWNFK